VRGANTQALTFTAQGRPVPTAKAKSEE